MAAVFDVRRYEHPIRIRRDVPHLLAEADLWCRRHVVLHTIGAAVLFIFINTYYSILLRINYLVMEKFAVIRETGHRDDDMEAPRHELSASSSSAADSSPVLLADNSASIVISDLPSSNPTVRASDNVDIHAKGREAKAVNLVSNLKWLRVVSVVICWLCLFGIIGFRVQFLREGGHKSSNKLRVQFLIFWANLFEWVWLGLVLLYGFIVFYWVRFAFLSNRSEL